MIKKITNLVLGLIITGMLLPMGLLYLYAGQYVSVVVSNTTYVLGEVMDPTIISLFTVILPIIILIGIVMYYIPKKSD